MTLTFPTRLIREVWHTGTLDPADKRRGSYEGAGLSVSRHPDAWERIARGRIRGTRHRLTCPDGLFLNALRMTRTHRDAIQAWGLSKGYVRVGRIYRITWYDDEMESTMQCDFTSLAKARGEKRDGPIKEMSGLLASRKLRTRILNDAAVVTVARELAPVYAEDVLDLDGTWWSDPLDVLTYNAPCGVITPSRLSRWQIRPDEPVRTATARFQEAA
jgi:hypothetical protein